MEISEIIKKGNASILLNWIKKHLDRKYADLLDKSEEESRRNLELR